MGGKLGVRDGEESPPVQWRQKKKRSRCGFPESERIGGRVKATAGGGERGIEWRNLGGVTSTRGSWKEGMGKAVQKDTEAGSHSSLNNTKRGEEGKGGKK